LGLTTQVALFSPREIVAWSKPSAAARVVFVRLDASTVEVDENGYRARFSMV
jgi:capsular polysaccharide biosynthesis protein